MWNGKRDKVEKQTRDGNGTEGRNEGTERRWKTRRERRGGRKRKYRQRNYECSGIKKQWLWGLKRAKIFWKSLLFLIYKYNLSIV